MAEPALVLGFHGGSSREFEPRTQQSFHHDAAAVLIKDGELVAAIEEERLSRVKHTDSFPANAIAACLAQVGANLTDVDLIATNFSELQHDLWASRLLMIDPGAKVQRGRQAVAMPFMRAFGVDVTDKLRFVAHHHVSHAWAGIAAAGGKDSLIVSLDGVGDDGNGGMISGYVAAYENGVLRELRRMPLFTGSLGLFYLRFCKFVGYKQFDEFKVMGLSPYGDRRTFDPTVQRMYTLLPNGAYTLSGLDESLGHALHGGLLEARRQKGTEEFTRLHQDIAASCQAALETIVMHVLEHFRKETGLSNLVLTGGVGHNCSMNGKVLYSNLFENVFVLPICHDAGGAFGAAVDALQREGGSYKAGKMKSLLLGKDVGSHQEIEARLSAWKDFVTYEKSEQITQRTARLLADGAVVGWVQGRSEFGPRALGNRSILADPRPAGNKDRINVMVKKREGYRPFAPSVLEEHCDRFFVPAKQESDYPFMIFVLRVRDEYRGALGAVTHVDGTARVQTVSKETNERYWNLISAFGELTGVPMLLNTSFNNNAEPIVDSVEDAIVCFLTTGIDYLVAGDFLVQKRKSELPHELLVPSISSGWSLTRISCASRGGVGDETYELSPPRQNEEFTHSPSKLSPQAFQILSRCNGKLSIAALAASCGFDLAQQQSVVAELVALWAKRVIRLAPSSSD